MQQRLIFNILIFSFFYTPLAIAKNINSETLSAPALIKSLQSGGYIIYMRHGPTDHNQKDKSRDNLNDCSLQRNLSNKGRELTKKIGSIIRAHKIPLGEVSSSPYCRCKDTAMLTFGKYNVESKLQFSISKDKEESKQLGQQLHSMMLNYKTNNYNRVFVGHTSNLRDGLGVWPKPEGVMVIFKKQKNKIIYKGMIRPKEWLKYNAANKSH